MKPQRKNIATVSTLMLVIASLFSCTGGEKASITTWDVPDSYKEECERGGVVEKLYYTAHDYALGSSLTEEKFCNVYLPYGYDSNKNYDILYVLHGTDPQSTVHQDTWLYQIGMKNVIDHMIDRKDIDPLIVVAPSIYSYTLYGDDDMTDIKEMTPVKKNSNENFAKELRYDILPAVEGKYSTYAETLSDDEFKESRDHRAIAGLSNGCRVTYTAGMIENFDYFSYFGCFSSSVASTDIIDALSQDKYSSLKLNYMFNCDGIYDFAYNAHKRMVEELLESPIFTSDNTEYVEVSFGYHSSRSWRVGLYNALQRFFR